VRIVADYFLNIMYNSYITYSSNALVGIFTMIDSKSFSWIIHTYSTW